MATGILIGLSCVLASPAMAAPSYTWPLSPRPAVTRGYDPPAQRWESGHRGVDLGAAPDASVLAAGSGRITFAGQVAGKPVVVIAHDDGISTTYEPVQPSVSRGDLVRRGQVIGTVQAGHPGCTVTACLHWGARRGVGPHPTYLNPLGLVGALRIRLKPVE